MKKRKKFNYFTMKAEHITLFSKIIIVTLVSGMFLGNLHLSLLASALKPEINTVINEDIERDFSCLDKIEEINELRTPNSKTYLKENGMYETEYYGETIHYKKDNEWIEIDNSLELKTNSRYENNSNQYNISFPSKLNKNNEIILTYLNNDIKINYQTNIDVFAELNHQIDRTKNNLKDEIIYELNSNESIQYIVKQDSIKENIILNSYVENYTYSYFIDTSLRVERIGNELYFYNGIEEVFVMNEYYMFDKNNYSSDDIDFEIITIDENTYQVIVEPSNDFLKTATYPVVIDPEITLRDGGILDGITEVVSIDKLTNTWQRLDVNNFKLENRNNSTSSDDLVAYIELYIPREYDQNIGDIITQNQLMYANLTLSTISSTNVVHGSKVDLKYATSFSWPVENEPPLYNTEYVDSQYFYGTNVFNHKFDILEGITKRLSAFKENDISLGFELSLDANANSSVTYSLGLDLGGNKPLITLGYLKDAGLSDYYTYESLPISDDSNVYISHNSGNLTFVYNDYNDGNLLNLSHIYNANRKQNNSQYGNGFNINYNEKISTFFNDSRLLLTEGDGREIVFYTQNEDNTIYYAGDGSLDILYKLVNNDNVTIGYKIETSNGGLKLYNIEGKLISIYLDKDDFNNSSSEDDTTALKIVISYNTDGTIQRVMDSIGNYMLFNYSSLVNSTEEEQTNISYLSHINIYKKLPNESNNERTLVQVEHIEYLYEEGNLKSIYKYGQSTISENTYLTYEDSNHINKIHKNNRGYTFEYDIKNRITLAKIYSSEFTNGDFLQFNYDSNGKKTRITNGLEDTTSYTFDDYYHTNSIETSDGYTTFYKYYDIYYDENGNVITSPNYNMNHKIILQSNAFKNTYNPINNHGFEIAENNNLVGWEIEVTNNSTAKIDNSIFLYGSRVLELNKKTNGTSQVYQEITVEEGKTYIVTGYIHNRQADGEGAYIEAVGSNGIITYLSSSNKVKNTENFVRYEYKFIANQSGKVKIYLINDSVGKAFFDNIQVNTNYVDTRYNYLTNSSFEDDTMYVWISNGNIFGWKFNNGCEFVDTNNLNDESRIIFNENCGNKYINLYYNSSISQTIYSPGRKGDTFVFGGYCFYENYTGHVTVKLEIIGENGNKSKIFTFDENDINATYMMNSITADEDYVGILVEITNNSNTSTAALDNFAIYKEGYGINLFYNDNGELVTEYNEIEDSTTNYQYDLDGNITQILTNNDEVNLTYLDNYLNTIEHQNIVITIKTDELGNITNIQAVGINENQEEDIKYDFGSTTMTDDMLYPNTETDIFGNVTTYTYDYLTNFVSSIVDFNNISTEYSYDSNGNITKIINGSMYNKITINYTYDVYGNLLSIQNGELIYTFTYNDYGDLKTISVGDSVLLTNNYKNENNSTDTYTSELIESIYSYGTISIEYNDNHQIEKIYNGTGSQKELILQYTYNDYGEIAIYTDYKENVTYYYNYDYENKLINVNATNGNNVTYTYDSDSYLTSKENLNGNNNYIYTDYNLDENIEDKKLSTEQIENLFNISYNYSNDSYKQLETINYYNNTLSISKNYTYETTFKEYEEENTTYNKEIYTGRIKEFEYINGDNQLIKYVYTYDYYDNISTISTYTNNILVSYEENYYDIFNQLTGHCIEINGEAYYNEYRYDSRGNIIGYCSQIIGYEVLYSCEFYYDNKDQMTTATINGTVYNITYSQTGQPSTYLGWTISYDMRSISVISNDDYRVEYQYNANGVRIQKIITHNSTTETIDYLLEGNNIIRETHTGINNYTINYYYDSNNEIIGFTYNNNKYLYLKNLQNDIIGIVDENNNLMVKYYYDGYGKIIKTIDTSGINLSSINPFRFRSYYQDNETNWYYLNSRYYNAVTNRFITMDSIEYLGASGSLLSYNLYSYCENNPVNIVDYNGTDAIFVCDMEMLKVLGHAQLYYQYNGIWHLTHFGANTSRTTAEFKSYENKSLNQIINGFSKKQKYFYIKGDFSVIHNKVLEYHGEYYGKYNLIKNNCLHYVLKLLRMVDISDPLLKKFINNTKLIIPSFFYTDAIKNISKNYTPKINVLSAPSLVRRVI